jgi:diguanylate cyclase (GGDEF)-like protein
MSLLLHKKTLRQRLLAESKPLLVSLDRAGCIEEVVGDAAHYGYESLSRGSDVQKCFDFMVGIKPPEKMEFPFLETPNGRSARIEIDLQGDRGVIMFFESTNEREVLQGVVKTGNESAIARYRTEETIRRFHDLQARNERTQQALRWASEFKKEVVGLLKNHISPQLDVLYQELNALQLPTRDGAASVADLASELQRVVAKALGQPSITQTEPSNEKLQRRSSDRIELPERQAIALPPTTHHVDAMIVGNAHRHTEKLIGELATRGFLVQTTEPNEEGVRDVIATRPRLIFIEVGNNIAAPVAFENLKRIRAALDYQPPVIVISDDDQFGTRELADHADVTAFFTMPLRIKNLMPLVNEALGADMATPPAVLLLTADPGYAEMFGKATLDSELGLVVLGDPEHALNYIQENPIDSVLVDCLTMPLVGRNFIRLLRQHETFFSLPIFALTEGRALLDTERALASLADKCHPKWKDLDTLIESLVTGTRRHRRSHSLSRTDFLTGLLTRAVFLEQLEVEISRIKRGGVVSCLAIFDIDNFKQVNDRYGHHGGDLALRAVAMNFISRLRKTDIVARYAGDEITVFLADTDLANAEQILESIRVEICENEINQDDRRFNISVSCGLIEMGRRVTGGVTTEWAMQQVDLLLYEAKEGGRNCIKSRGW